MLLSRESVVFLIIIQHKSTHAYDTPVATFTNMVQL